MDFEIPINTFTKGKFVSDVDRSRTNDDCHHFKQMVFWALETYE